MTDPTQSTIFNTEESSIDPIKAHILDHFLAGINEGNSPIPEGENWAYVPITEYGIGFHYTTETTVTYQNSDNPTETLLTMPDGSTWIVFSEIIPNIVDDVKVGEICLVISNDLKRR